MATGLQAEPRSTGFARHLEGARSARQIANPAVVDLRDLAPGRTRTTAARADAVHTIAASTVSPPLSQGVHFDSIGSTECCGGGLASPPDPDIAAGPSHLIVAVNLSFEIYDKSGTSLVGPLELDSFFAIVGGGCAQPNSVFYPATLYDEEANRFVLVADGDGTHLCVAASQTGDPTGAWNLYAFSVTHLGDVLDRPRPGIGREALYVGGIVLGTLSGTGHALAIQKSTLYAGLVTFMVARSLGGHSHPQPLHLHRPFPPSGPHYILSLTDPPDAGSVTLHSWSDPFGTDTLTTIDDLDVAAEHGIVVGAPIAFPQSGGNAIAAAADLLNDFEYRDGSGFTTSHVECSAAGGPVDCVQWAEIDLDSAAVIQAGVFGTSGVYRTYPDLGVNACGDMVVGYTRSSSATFPSIAVAGRRAGDPSGTLQPEIVAKTGEVTYTFTSNRWGEYTGMTTDPDGQVFWYAGQYSKNTGGPFNWGTYVSSFAFPCVVFRDGFESGSVSAWSGSVP
jgi:hypothetical protein